MKSIIIDGQIDEQHLLRAVVPTNLLPGPFRFVMTILEGDDELFVDDWTRGIGKQWLAKLSDPREDIYTLDDGEPINWSK